MRITYHRAFEEAAAEFKNYKLTPEGIETIKEHKDELLSVVSPEELLKTEESEKRGGLTMFVHFASYCPKCDQLNWHCWVNLQEPKVYLRAFSRKTCCQTCNTFYLVGDNLDPHLVTLWQLGCLFKIIAAIFILMVICHLIGIF